VKRQVGQAVMGERRLRSPWSVAAALGTVALALPALAQPPDTAPSLAAPGECAQPEREIVTSPQEASPFDPAGAPVQHFAPADVASGLPAPARPTPRDPGSPRDGGCDAPDAGCVGRLPVSRGLVESPPQPGLPPGAGGGVRP